jgi:Lrp/AsnC family transcriptional regulator for asnA, asnC and gidA
LQKRTKIDETNAEILKTLLKESRTSFTKIAKDCEITVGAVRMRYKRLWKEGVITGEVMQVNPRSLGYQYICDLGITTAVENEKEIMKFLTRKPYIAHMAGPLGKYNIWAKVAIRKTNDLTEILEDIEGNPQIENVDALIWVEAVNLEYPENLIINSFDMGSKQRNNNNEQNLTRTPTKTMKKTRVKIDETDRKIAIILSQNSRTPFRQIADQLNISTKNVIQRYKRLRKNVLPRSTITIDPNKLGYSTMANVFVKAANRSKLPEIHAQLLQIPNLIVAIRLIGAYDLYATIFLANFQEFFNAKEQIRRMPNIEKTEFILTPIVPEWPLNLFPSLLQSEFMGPKFAFEKAN